MQWKKAYDFLQRLVVLSSIPILSFAAKNSGIGGVATNIMDPVSVLTNFVHSACLLLGGIFIFAGIIKYFEHRRSPTMVTMSTVVFLFIAGIVLILLPAISYLKTYGIPYHLFN